MLILSGLGSLLLFVVFIVTAFGGGILFFLGAVLMLAVPFLLSFLNWRPKP